jgi:EAL domain-containing protein (putative c-di-GMP-specific phosphodiesterase class I)
LPVDALKIDRSFLGRLTEPDGLMGPITAMIAAGHTLRMTVIAEDIETLVTISSLCQKTKTPTTDDRPLNGRPVGRCWQFV